jgi:mannitol operon transcriptional antiterminator
MSLDERSTLILSQLMKSEIYIPVEKITEKLRISRRTVYYDLEKINYWLQDHHLDPVEHVRSLGLYLPDETKKKVPSMVKKLDTWQYYYSEKERQAILAIHLITSTDAVFLKDLMEKIRVSRGTTNNELNKLKEELEAFNLVITFHRKKGYLTEGNESDKRKALVHYLSQILSNDGWNYLVSEVQLLLNAELEKNNDFHQKPAIAFVEEHLSKVYQIIDKCEDELGIKITDDMLDNLAIRLLISSNRLLQGKRIVMDEDEKEVLKSTREYAAAQNISKKLEEIILIQFPEDEVCYISINLLGSKVNYMKDGTNSDEDVKQLKLIIRRMVDDFQRFACVFFQDRSLIEEKMLIHLKPAYYRIRYGLEVENPLTETIKQKYNEIFEITKKVIPHLENFIGRNVNEKEIAYLAMHFGGWMKKEGSRPVARKKALIVCGNGVSTSRILQTQLENLLSTVDIVSVISLREYESHHYDVDFIVSTTPIKKRDKPVFTVNPILTDKEKETLLKQINALEATNQRENSYSVKTLIDIVKRHANITNEQVLFEDLSQFLYREKQIIKEPGKPMLNKLITLDTIQIKSEVKDWKEAIQVASNPLLERGYINQNYVAAMIESVLELGPYIVLAPRIAVPHARPEQGVNQLGMSLLCLKNSVPFSDDNKHDVNLIIVLAATDKKTHIKAISQLSEMLSEEQDVEAILHADSSDQIVTIVNKYSIN